MLGFIKNWFKQKTNKEIKKKPHATPQRVVDMYFRYLEYGITTFDVDYFCKECRMSEEDITEVHNLIKEGLIKIKMEQLKGDFE